MDFNFNLYRNSPLAKKILFVILIVSFFVTLILILIQLYSEYKFEMSYIDKRLKHVQSYIAPLTLSVWTFDKNQYDALLNGIHNIQDIEYVQVLDEANKEILSIGVYQEKDLIVKEFLLVSQIASKKINVGKLVIHVSLHRIFNDLYKRAIIIMITQAIKTLIISLLILYLFHIFVTRYLYKISNYTSNINLKNDEQLILDRDLKGDELDDIANAINQLKSRVQFQQKELENLNTQLELKVKKRTKKLEELMLVQSKMAAMGRMIEDIAHQWRQPLSGINSNVLLIDRKILKLPKATVSIENELNTIESITQYLSRTINDIRSFYDTEKKMVRFTIEELLENTLNIVRGSIPHNIEVIINIEKNITLCSYMNELQQVLLAVIINAKDVLIARNIEKPKINIIVTNSNKSNTSTIQIIDNGGGIDEIYLNKVFDLYFSTKKESSGTGIGLYISKIIVEQSLGGQIGAKNVSEGTCLEIIIPITI